MLTSAWMPRVLHRSEDIGHATPAPARDRDVRRIRLRDGAQVADQELDIADLGLDTLKIQGHAVRMHAEAGAGKHDEAVTGEVLAEVRVLEGGSAQAGRIDDYREGPGLRACIFEGFGHLNALALVILADVVRLKESLQLDGALFCAKGNEVVLVRHEVEIPAEEHRLGAGGRLRGIPDQRLDGAGPLSRD